MFYRLVHKVQLEWLILFDNNDRWIKNIKFKKVFNKKELEISKHHIKLDMLHVEVYFAPSYLTHMDWNIVLIIQPPKQLTEIVRGGSLTLAIRF